MRFGISQIGSMKNGTVHKMELLAANKNRLYLCNAFETQVQNLVKLI